MRTLLTISAFLVTGCGTLPIQSVAGAGVAPNGTAFFIETRNNGHNEYLLICKEFGLGEAGCRRYEIDQPSAGARPLE